MNYADWNKRLVTHFFGHHNQEEDVILAVDKDFFRDQIAPELGDNAWRDFVQACIQHQPDGRSNRTACEKALCESSRHRPVDGSPPHLGYLCLMVLAWTHDHERHPLNYYGRLQSLLEECGQPTTVPYIDSQRFARMRSAWSTLADWANKIKKGALGFFDDGSIGPDVHVGRPLRHALISAADRRKLISLFSEIDASFTADRPSHREMKDLLRCKLKGRISSGGYSKFESYPEEFTRTVCSIYEAWDGESDNGPKGPRAHLAFCIQSTALNTKQLRVQLHYRDENFPETIVHGRLESGGAHSPIEIAFKRYQHGWSGNASLPALKKDWEPGADFLSGWSSIKLASAAVPLHPRGINQGVLYFERPAFGPSRQTLRFQKGVPCFVLVKECVTAAKRFVQANQTCLQPEKLVPEILGWELFSSSGLLELGGFAQTSEPPRLALRGGGRLYAKRPVYYPDALPSVECFYPPTGSVLQLLDAIEGSLLKGFDSAGPMVRLSREDVVQSSHISVALVHDGKVLDTVRFRIEQPVMAPDIASNWPDSSADYFPFDPMLDLVGAVSYRKEDAFILQEGAHLEVSVKPPHSDWELFLDETAFGKGNSWQVSAASVAAGQRELKARWRGVELAKRTVLAIEPTACHVDGPIGMSFSSTDPETGLDVFPCPDAGASFRVTGNQDLRIDISYGHAHWQRIHCRAREAATFTVPAPAATSRPSRLDIYCYTATGGGLVDSKSLYLRRRPSPIVKLEGETFHGMDIYRADKPLRMRLLLPPEDDVRLSVKVGDSECAFVDGVYRLPLDVFGHRLPIRVFWGTCVVHHHGPARVSIEAVPKAVLALVGGVKDGDGRYYKGRLPAVKVEPFAGTVRNQGRLFLDGRGKLTWTDAGFALLPNNLAEGSHSIVLAWRDQTLATMAFEVIKPPNCKLVPDRKHDLSDLYRTEPMPALVVDTSSMPPGLVSQVRFVLEQPDAAAAAAPLGFEEGRILLDSWLITDGELKVKAMLGDVPIGSIALRFLDDSWIRIGPFPGQFADTGEPTDWHPCWYLKKKGHDYIALLDDWCPRAECSKCLHAGRASWPNMSEWKKSVKLKTKFQANRDREQWQRFVHWRRAS